MLYARVEVPSARTISRDVQEIFEMSKQNVISMLKVRTLLLASFSYSEKWEQAYPGKVHIGLDGWTSPNVFSYLGLVIYMLRDEELVSLVLDFVK